MTTACHPRRLWVISYFVISSHQARRISERSLQTLWKNIFFQLSGKSLIQYCDQSLAHRKSDEVLYSEKDLEIIFSDVQEKIKRYYSPYSYALLLHAEIGCRPNELICLKWSDIDFENELLYIERQQIEARYPKPSYRVVDYTKNEKGVSQGGRIVPLSSKALEVLLQLKAEKEALGIESDWIFTNICRH